ncbi:MAG: hypothetical protein JOS17DRAFT_483180 [Linnemannia elongata]|nr:MAG: hypothetical protein JOS17DRAFT_483180 [Linnemannia elongata]
MQPFSIQSCASFNSHTRSPTHTLEEAGHHSTLSSSSSSNSSAPHSSFSISQPFFLFSSLSLSLSLFFFLFSFFFPFTRPSLPSFPSLLSDPPTPLVVFLCHCTPLLITYLYSPPPDTDTDLDTDIQTTLGQYSSSSLTKNPFFTCSFPSKQ